MIPASHDLARVRFGNAMRLFDEFVHATVKHPDAATLRGLDRRFAERLQIQPSYWSQIKSRSRQIGERLARQFEQLCHKPAGWMDRVHDTADSEPPAPPGRASNDAAGAASPLVAQDDDERFIVGLVLTYYRRHPQRARARLLDLLGEVLVMPPSPPPASRAQPSAGPAAAAQASDDHRLWQRTQAGIAPLKRPRR